MLVSSSELAWRRICCIYAIRLARKEKILAAREAYLQLVVHASEVEGLCVPCKASAEAAIEAGVCPLASTEAPEVHLKPLSV